MLTSDRFDQCTASASCKPFNNHSQTRLIYTNEIVGSNPHCDAFTHPGDLQTRRCQGNDVSRLHYSLLKQEDIKMPSFRPVLPSHSVKRFIYSFHSQDVEISLFPTFLSYSLGFFVLDRTLLRSNIP